MAKNEALDIKGEKILYCTWVGYVRAALDRCSVSSITEVALDLAPCVPTDLFPMTDLNPTWAETAEALIIALEKSDTPERRETARKLLRHMATIADRASEAERKDKNAHPVGTRVQVLHGHDWIGGTVHKRIYDDKLTYHDHGDVVTTTTWVVWLDDHSWWRGDMAEHIRKA
jgi:hypothetical protein